MTGIVYFLQCQPHGPIKIGFTTRNVYNRVRSLQAASPYELKWIGFFNGAITDETAAHKLLAKSRLRCEWFHPTAEVFAFINEKCPDFDPSGLIDEMFFVKELEIVKQFIPPHGRDNYERMGELEKVVKLDRWHIWRWFHKELPLSKEQCEAAASYAASRLAELASVSEAA